MLDYEREEITGMKIYDFLDHPQSEVDAIIQNVLQAGDIVVGERKYKGKNGDIVEVDVSAKLIQYGGTEILLVIIRDITNRKRIEEETIRLKKLESVGVLAGGIAHDFNNLLTGVLGNLEMSLKLIEDHHPAIDRLYATQRAALRARELTSKLLTFASGGDPVRKTAYLSELLKDSVGFVLSGSNVSPNYQMDDDLWPVEMDHAQIGQVMQNLAVNADQAMPNGGTITFTCTNEVIGDGELVGLGAGTYVKIVVADTGKGIAVENQKNIFDPFFSTKTDGTTHGRGLGLSIVHSIITKHGGRITVESKLSKGTAFTLYIPAVPGEKPSAGVEVYEISYGEGRVLIMDDDEMIIEILTEMLEHVGYEVLASRHGEEALEIFRNEKEQGRQIDLTLMDLTIPGKIGGKEAVKMLLEFDDTAKVIVTSGYSNDPVLENYKKYGFCDIVTKPFKMDELTSVVTRVLADH
jgi:signal transduction histidine kinase/ActR/RegA family two-component response regulator